MKVFDAYSSYYNLLYKDKDYQAEADYIASLLGNNVKTVFEMGCGTGKHASLLMKKGYDVFGIDQSLTMLKQAKELGVDCDLGDVRYYDCKRKFDAVISLFHVASYQNTDEDVNKYFQTAKKHLKPQGKFIFDVWHKDAVLTQLPEKRVKKMEDDEVRVVRYCEPKHFPEKDIVEVNYHIEILNKKQTSDIYIYIDECHSMRYFSCEEIERFAHKAGFKIVDNIVWMTHDKPSSDSWGVCYILEVN